MTIKQKKELKAASPFEVRLLMSKTPERGRLFAFPFRGSSASSFPKKKKGGGYELHKSTSQQGLL